MVNSQDTRPLLYRLPAVLRVMLVVRTKDVAPPLFDKRGTATSPLYCRWLTGEDVPHHSVLEAQPYGWYRGHHHHVRA